MRERICGNPETVFRGDVASEPGAHVFGVGVRLPIRGVEREKEPVRGLPKTS